MRINSVREVAPIDLARSAHDAYVRHLLATGVATKAQTYEWEELTVQMKTAWLSVVYAIAAEADPDRWSWTREELP